MFIDLTRGGILIRHRGTPVRVADVQIHTALSKKVHVPHAGWVRPFEPKGHRGRVRAEADSPACGVESEVPNFLGKRIPGAHGQTPKLAVVLLKPGQAGNIDFGAHHRHPMQGCILGGDQSGDHQQGGTSSKHATKIAESLGVGDARLVEPAIPTAGGPLIYTAPSGRI